jgi:endonuclease YncB( thermonuclease family)
MRPTDALMYSRSMLRRLLLLLLLAAVPAARAAADAIRLPDGLKAGGSAVAVSVVDGDTLVLDDGKQVRLVGIQAPKLPLGRSGFPTWPLAQESKTALERLALNRRLTLHYGGREVDRHRRLLAHLVDAETGQWIQGAMLAQGMARVYTFKDNRGIVPEMLALERAARAARRGIWGLRYYAVRTPETVARDVGSFQLVEGVVHAVAERKNITFVNFAADWKTDFTIVVRGADRKAFRDAGLSLPDLAGKRVRVRGWVKSWNGPMIEATHPEQIETAGLGPADR